MHVPPHPWRCDDVDESNDDLTLVLVPSFYNFLSGVKEKSMCELPACRHPLTLVLKRQSRSVMPLGAVQNMLCRQKLSRSQRP